jgi:hypothetical protein
LAGLVRHERRWNGGSQAISVQEIRLFLDRVDMAWYCRSCLADQNVVLRRRDNSGISIAPAADWKFSGDGLATQKLALSKGS